MRILQTDFIQNADKSGNNRFIQVRKEKDVALYRRETTEGHLIGFEVFRFKTIQAGAPLPGGGVVEETYESYPGGKAFGRTAWFCGDEERAVARFNELLTGKAAVVEAEGETEHEAVPVVRVVSTAPIKEGLKLPDGPFTQKELASFNGFDNYKVVYSDLQKMLSKGILKVSEKVHDSTRGKSAKMFERV